MLRSLTAVAALWIASHALAQTAAPSGPAPSPPAKIADVAFLEGSWTGEGMGGATDEFWLPARGGVMMGAFRVMKPDGSPNFYEIFAIEEHEGSLRFIVKHFTPEWVGWEEKDKALRLRLTALGKNEATFGGVHFHSPDPQTLAVRVTIGAKDGTKRIETFNFKKKPA